LIDHGIAIEHVEGMRKEAKEQRLKKIYEKIHADASTSKKEKNPD